MPKTRATVLHVDDRELATILAALRFWQGHGPGQPNSFFDRLQCDEQDLLDEVRTNSGLLEPLRPPEIGDLCERFNMGEGRRAPQGLVIEPPEEESGEEPPFRVVYAVDVNAASPRDAAEQVRQMMVDPDSMPPVLEIIDHLGKVVSIDLSEDVSA